MGRPLLSWHTSLQIREYLTCHLLLIGVIELDGKTTGDKGVLWI
jgi:hypothetical protein